MEKYRSNRTAILLFLFPAFLIYCIFEVIPILQTFYFSLFTWNGFNTVPMEYVGFQNFIHLFNDPQFLLTMKNIGWFIILSLFTQLPLGFLLAILLGSYFKGYKLFKMAYFSPIVLSITAVSLMWYFILMPNNGVLDTLLKNIGLEAIARNWLIDKGTALNSLILVNAWIAVGFYMTIAFAAVNALPQTIMEAAEMDGAVGIRKLIFITLPMIQETIKICIILVITGTLKIFEIVLIMTKGGPNGLTEVPVTYLYNSAFRYDNYGTGNAIAIVIFFLSVLVTVLSLKLMAQDKLEY